MNADVLFSAKSILGEGAWYDFKRNVLLWIDIWGCEVHEYYTRLKKDVCHKMDIPVTSIVPADDGYILGTTNGVSLTDKCFKGMTPIISPNYDYEKFRCNDGKCGPDGRFWIGIMERNGQEGMGALYAVDGKVCELKLKNLDVPNGIVWNRDRNKMYFTDTLSKKIHSYNYLNGKLSKKTVVFQADDGMPDGMTIDENDNIWVAVWGSGSVYNIDPNTGDILNKIETPAPNVSSVAICEGRLYITSATSGLNDDELKKYPESGSLFIADVPVNGIEAYRYKY